ncbi:MAG: hypothetical protein ACOYOQ_00365 [Microthrixaceae bacterium]
MNKQELAGLDPGTRVVVARNDSWGTFKRDAVFLGVDRGLAVLAEPNTNNPFWVDVDGNQPSLRNTTWKPRRARAASIQLRSEYDAEVAEARAAREARVAAEVALKVAREEAARRLARTLSEYEVGAYVDRDGVHVYGAPEAMHRLADLLDIVYARTGGK